MRTRHGSCNKLTLYDVLVGSACSRRWANFATIPKNWWRKARRWLPPCWYTECSVNNCHDAAESSNCHAPIRKNRDIAGLFHLHSPFCESYHNAIQNATTTGYPSSTALEDAATRGHVFSGKHSLTELQSARSVTAP